MKRFFRAILRDCDPDGTDSGFAFGCFLGLIAFVLLAWVDFQNDDIINLKAAFGW